MKNACILALIFFTGNLWSQSESEVYLVDIERLNGAPKLTNLRNISNNPGYDNQPSFYDDNTILFSSTRNKQTDIAKYNLKTGESSWISHTAFGSEYSPLRIPESNDLSAIRLDSTGLQRLYSYDYSTGRSKILLKDQKVGYHVWHSRAVLVVTVLVDNRMDLTVTDFETDTTHTVAKNVGRSLQKIPNSDLISFVHLENTKSQLKSLNPVSGAIKTIMSIPSDRQDLTWLSADLILVPGGDEIIELDTKNGQQGSILHRFKEKEIHDLTRIAISPDGSKMALVSGVAPEKIVQKQVESFNAADLDAFAACYTENVVVMNFPNDTISSNNSELKAGYKRYFENSPKTTVEVIKRIQMGDFVIDEERIKISGQVHRQAAIYTVVGGKISKMTFLHEKQRNPEAEKIVDEQLKAYNKRDIEAFGTTYSENIQLFNYPNQLVSKGKESLYKSYEKLFEQTPDLFCKVENRIVIGNKVIDQEYITANGTNFSAVAIYEVENGKITNVTFIQ